MMMRSPFCIFTMGRRVVKSKYGSGSMAASGVASNWSTSHWTAPVAARATSNQPSKATTRIGWLKPGSGDVCHSTVMRDQPRACRAGRAPARTSLGWLAGRGPGQPADARPGGASAIQVRPGWSPISWPLPSW